SNKVVIGNPFLEEAVAAHPPSFREGRPTRWLVVSQPDARDELIKISALLSQKPGMTVYYRPHPMERNNPEALKPLFKSPNIIVEDKGDLYARLSEVDAVLG